MRSMPCLILAVLTAATPAPDLVAIAKAGQPPSFETVLDARFDPAGRAHFDAFRDWAAKLSPEERAQYYDQLPPGPDGKPRWHERVACGQADRHGLSRAMSFVAAHASDRAAARTLWDEAERAYAAAGTIESKYLAAANAKPRPTAIGRALAIRVAAD